MRIYIFPYTQQSKSAKALADELGVKRLRRSNSEVKDAEDLLIINWGATSTPFDLHATFINKPSLVAKATNKLSFFSTIETYNVVHPNMKVNIPNFTNHRMVAEAWISSNKIVCCREKLSSSNSEGLVLAETLSQLVDAPLYTLYTPKYSEYRVHVSNGNIIHVERKIWPSSRSDRPSDWRIRDVKSGFIFNKVTLASVPQVVKEQAVRAVKALDLDFGGVDVIWSKTYNKATVLEINTAPGIEDSDVKAYASSLRDIVKKIVS